MFIFNYSNIIDPLLRGVRRYVPIFAGMKTGDKVLDVCCGTGDQVFYYAENGITATGIDLNPKMIQVAQKDRRKKNFKNISFQIADATNLPFPDNYFDFASISFALHEKERGVRDKIIFEMKRVVKKGEGLIFIDFKHPLPPNPLSFFIRGIERYAGKEHFENFKDYLRQGGLQEILEKNKIRKEKREILKGEIVEMIKARNT